MKTITLQPLFKYSALNTLVYQRQPGDYVLVTESFKRVTLTYEPHDHTQEQPDDDLNLSQTVSDDYEHVNISSAYNITSADDVSINADYNGATLHPNELEDIINSQDDASIHEILEEYGYTYTESNLTLTGPVELKETVTTKQHNYLVSHTYDYQNQQRYKAYSEQQYVIELLREEYTPQAIHYRLTELLSQYGIKLTKRHATKYTLVTPEYHSVTIRLDDGHFNGSVTVKSHDYTVKHYDTRNHRELSAALEAIENFLIATQTER